MKPNPPKHIRCDPILLAGWYGWRIKELQAEIRRLRRLQREAVKKVMADVEDK